jgi:hypothetical protein
MPSNKLHQINGFTEKTEPFARQCCEKLDLLMKMQLPDSGLRQNDITFALFQSSDGVKLYVEPQTKNGSK